MATEKKKVITKKFTLARELNDADKCPPQAKVVVGVIKSLGGKADRAAIIDKLKAAGTLTTNQTVERIFGFYRPRLIAMGVLKEEVEETVVEVQVPDKPAKAEKPAGEKKGEGSTKAHDVKDTKGSRQVA